MLLDLPLQACARFHGAPGDAIHGGFSIVLSTVIQQHAEPNTLPTRKSTFCNSTRTGVSQLAPVSARYSALWTATRLPHHRLHATHASRSRSLHLLLAPSQARVGAALLVQSAPPDLVMHHAAMSPLPFPHPAHRQVVDEDQDKRELAGSRGTRINCSTWGGVQVVCPFQWCPPRWSHLPICRSGPQVSPKALSKPGIT